LLRKVFRFNENFFTAFSGALIMLTQHDLSASPWLAQLNLTFAAQENRTVLTHRKHFGPLRVQKTLYPEGLNIAHAIILHPPGGIAGGDQLDITVQMAPHTHAVISTPGANKWYKSQNQWARQHISIQLDAHAKLDWLPQENILFNQSKVSLNARFNIHPTASMIGWDCCVLGRTASGELWRDGELNVQTKIAMSDTSLPCWLEEFSLTANDPLLTHLTGLGGLAVLGTLWACGPHITGELTENLAEMLPFEDDLRAGVSFVCDTRNSDLNILLMRVTGSDMQKVRALLIKTWMYLRQPIHGIQAQPLRLWAT
jgi:urease accessory protein